MARTSSIYVYDHFDIYLTPVTLTFNLPKKMFQMALLLLKGNNCTKSMHYCTIYGPDKSGRIHRTKIVTTTSRLPASGLDKNSSAEEILRGAWADFNQGRSNPIAQCPRLVISEVRQVQIYLSVVHG